jgi:dipeptidyl aminopeptidase/acylaminoacyl peptidase
MVARAALLTALRRGRLLLSALLFASAAIALAAAQGVDRPRTDRRPPPASPTRTLPPDFELMRRQQAETDRVWLEASVGHMRMEKIVYSSRAGELPIPAFLFQPLDLNGTAGHPALVWVHENIRGHLYEHYVPFIRQATAKGFVVIAPEYRGSIGYGPELYDAIDYGGTEVDDVVTAVDVLTSRVPEVDPRRIGIIGWSHGGMIALLAVFRNPSTFASAVAIVPVTNLFQRLAYKGVEEQRAQIDPNNRFGGTPAQRPSVYRDRSPLFHVDRLRIPLRVHIADNDRDVSIEEGMQLVDALRARQPLLAETEVFLNPPGGHLFDRRVNPHTLQPENTSAQRESWEKVWAFFDRTLKPGAPARGGRSR